jgi:hypothetical protein
MTIYTENLPACEQEWTKSTYKFTLRDYINNVDKYHVKAEFAGGSIAIVVTVVADNITYTGVIKGNVLNNVYANIKRHSVDLLPTDTDNPAWLPLCQAMWLLPNVYRHGEVEYLTDADDDAIVSYNGGNYTLEEFAEFGICDDCDSIITESDNNYITDNNSTICESCYRDDYFTCERCGDIYAIGDSVEIHDLGEYWCESCADNSAYRCPDCGEYNRRRSIGDCCDSCGENYVSCYHCGDAVHIDNAETDDDGDSYCSSCASDHIVRHTALRTYHDNPTIKRHGIMAPRTLTFGIEQETEFGQDKEEFAEWLAENLGDDETNFWCSEDGSLDGRTGVEIIHQPRTMDSWLEYVPTLEAIKKQCQATGRKSHDAENCGLHVHVGRNEICNIVADNGSVQDAYRRMIYLLERFQPQIFRFTRRTQETIDAYAKFYSRYHEVTVAHPNDCGRDSPRKVALNLTKSNTIEFRIFRGTMQPETVLASIQLCEAIVLSACELTNDDCLTLSWDSLLTYCNRAEILAYAEKRKLYVKPDCKNCN